MTWLIKLGLSLILAQDHASWLRLVDLQNFTSKQDLILSKFKSKLAQRIRPNKSPLIIPIDRNLFEISNILNKWKQILKIECMNHFAPPHAKQHLNGREKQLNYGYLSGHAHSTENRGE